MPVLDLCWSPTNATVLVCVYENAMEIWNISQNVYVFIYLHLA